MILITVPHAAPGEGQDEGATRFVYLLEDSLRQAGEIVTVIEGDVPRDILDLNRTDAAKSDFVMEVFDAMMEASVHIDLHSFPDISGETEHGYDLDVWREGTVVLFNIPEVTDAGLLSAIVGAFEDDGVASMIQEAGFENYLTNAASTLFDAPSILVEVNDAAGRDYQMVVDALVEGIARFLAGQDTPDDVRTLDEEEQSPAQ